MKKIITSIFIGFALFSCSSDDNISSTGTPIGGGGNTATPTQYTDTQLVEMVQKDALKYFWDYAESNSKLARERYHTDNPGQDANVVSAGGSGFGLMTILVGIKNGYVTKAEASLKIINCIEFPSER